MLRTAYTFSANPGLQWTVNTSTPVANVYGYTILVGAGIAGPPAPT